MSVQTIIFDLDGTLIHSAPDLQAAMNATLKGMGREPLTLAQIISFIGNGVEKLVARSLAATGGGDSETEQRALAKFLRIYEADPYSRTEPYPGVVEMLVALKKQGIPLGICTNKPTAPARQICDALDLTHYFDFISGADPDTPKKPDATPLINVIEALGGGISNALYVGDSLVDQATAHNARVPFAFFTGGYLNGALVTPLPAYSFDDWRTDWPSFLR